MSTEINLSGVEAGNKGSDKKFVKPGIQTVTIASLELITSNNDKSGLKVTFNSKENEAPFNETFWLSEKALPRLQYLIKLFTGEKHEGKITVEELSAKLVGKTEEIIVDGREALSNPVTQEDGTIKTFVNVYPQLRFADFGTKDARSLEVNIQKLPSEVPTSGTDDGLPF